MTEVILVTETGLNVPGSLVVQVSTETERSDVGMLRYPRNMYFVHHDEMNNATKLLPIEWEVVAALAPGRHKRMAALVTAAHNAIEQYKHDEAKGALAKQREEAAEAGRRSLAGLCSSRSWGFGV